MSWWKKTIGWIMVAVFLFALLNMCTLSPPSSPSSLDGRTQVVQKAYSDLVSLIEQKSVTDVYIINDKKIRGRLKDDTLFEAIIPSQDSSLRAKLLANGATVLISSEEESDSSPGFFRQLFMSSLPIVLFFGLWIFLMRKMTGGKDGGMMGFGKSKAKLLRHGPRGRVTFEDVAGVDEAKEELREIVEFLENPQKFQKLGAKIPKGALLVGLPGTGKTLLARAVAGEANVPFFTISGSDFVEMFVGVGAARVRDMFDEGRKHAPCIIFIDEIDAVGRHRGAGLGGGHDEKEQTLNQLLVEMDGFESNEGVILIGATNRPDVLDPALLRPGRFDRQVVVPLPDVVGREKILAVHIKAVPLAPNVNVRDIARGTPGFSGADLANLVNEAALLAARAGEKVVTSRTLEKAKDKVIMGAERRSAIISKYEKEITAYHEAGHALVGHHVKGNETVHKISIIPRGRALGVTSMLPKEDRYMVQERQLKARLALLFGGRVAEELRSGEKDKVTTGASDDIRKATEIARAMITEFGFSDKLGRVRYSEDEEEMFLARSVMRRKNISERTAQLIDEEIRCLIDEAESKAREILTKHLDDLHKLASALLEYETISGEEMVKIFKGEPIRTNGNGNGK